MSQNLQMISDLIQQAENLSAQEKVALSKVVSDAAKELEQKGKVVEAQNRELEIESSLEREIGRAHV
jgi:hypothetical protein